MKLGTKSLDDAKNVVLTSKHLDNIGSVRPLIDMMAFDKNIIVKNVESFKAGVLCV